MSQKTFLLSAGVVFFLIALGHILRVAFGLEWIVAGRTVPMWASVLAVIVTGYLAFEGFRLSRKLQSGW
jgi:hypothetical protein